MVLYGTYQKQDVKCTRMWNADKFGSEGETSFEDDTLVLKKTITAKLKRSMKWQCTSKLVSRSWLLKSWIQLLTSTANYNHDKHCQYPRVDTIFSEEGLGKLNYKLLTDDNVDIAKIIQVKIESINKNLFQHAILDCKVTKDGYSISVLNSDENKKIK